MNGAYSAHLSPVDIAIAESSGAFDIHIGVMILRRTAIHLYLLPLRVQLVNQLYLPPLALGFLLGIENKSKDTF